MGERRRVAILGASDNEERYAYKAFVMLREHGHEIVPVNPSLPELEGVSVRRSLAEITGRIDTLTVYLNPQRSRGEIPRILALRPERAILNPGAESEELRTALSEAGIPYLEACTLVLLRTGQF